MIPLSFLAESLPQCCEIDAFSIELCCEAEADALRKLLPQCKSVIVLAHHVQQALEWIWFPLECERNNVTCPADLHLKSECEKTAAAIALQGFNSVIVPYPGRCGLRFKDLADKTGLGKIGDSFLFLHKEWGAWTHLRVIITDAEISCTLPPWGEVCNHCGNCKAVCPAQLIKDDNLLGVECDTYQDLRDAETGTSGYVFKCEECVRACPIGTAPKRLEIKELKGQA